VKQNEVQSPGQYWKIYQQLKYYENILEPDYTQPQNTQPKIDAVVKVILIGDAGAGKVRPLKTANKTFHDTIFFRPDYIISQMGLRRFHHSLEPNY
jgi:hypothetical protein